MLDGWTIASSYGARATRPASSSALMSRSESSTRWTLYGAGRRTWETATVTWTPAWSSTSTPTYVALGDSFTEGVGDADPDRPNGVRGWADRVAEVLAAEADDFGYANLAIRGRKLRPILAEQLEPALALEPDRVTIYAGAYDIMRASVDGDAL